MKKIYTLAMASLLISETAVAQRQFEHKQIPLKSKAVKCDSKQNLKEAFKRLKQKKAAALMLPSKEQSYFYDGTEWLEDALYTFKYDNNGNITEQVVDDGVSKTKTINEYNGFGNMVRELTMVAEGSSAYTNTSKLETDYDNIVTDFTTKSTDYLWNSNDWIVNGTQGKTWKKNITRDKDSKVNKLTISTLYQNQYSVLQRTTLNYNKDTGKADSWKLEELYYDGVSESMTEIYTLSNMKWKTTDHQILTIDLEQFFTGNNKLEYAEVYEPGAGLVGTISASYKDNGDYSYQFYYNGNADADVYEMIHTDDKGSYKELMKYYIDEDKNQILDENEMQSVQCMEVVMDDHGRVISEVLQEGKEVLDGMKYEYKYDNGTDYPSEQIFLMWNPETSTFKPFIKIVASEFKDVTTSIDNVQVQVNSTESAVYNTMGVKVGSSLEELPNGLYIVKKNGKTFKVLKK